MFRKVVPLAALLVLTGCGSASVVYQLTISPSAGDHADELVPASLRVVERRMESVGEHPLDLALEKGAGTPKIRVEAAEKQVLENLTGELTEPFKWRVMKQAPEGATDVLVVEGHGPFTETGLDESHVLWLEATQDSQPGMGRVTITFTQEGRDMMGQVFKENVGKFIGIFVRDRLVSKLLVETDTLKDDIVITEIPTLDLAQVFADDVNVGLHVTFAPTK